MNQDEISLGESLKKLDSQSKTFSTSSAEWALRTPESLGSLDLQFVMGNRHQFRETEFLNQIDASARTFFQELGSESRSITKGDRVHFGEDVLQQESPSGVSNEISEFERANKRRFAGPSGLYRNDDSDFYLASFAGLDFKHGLEYLRQVGLFYYQLKIEVARTELSLLKEFKQSRSNKLKLSSEEGFDARLDDDDSTDYDDMSAESDDDYDQGSEND